MDDRRLVIENYPASRLPSDLRGSIDPTHRVRVIIEDAIAPRRLSFREVFGAAKDRNTPVEEAVERIRKLRDEWAP